MDSKTEYINLIKSDTGNMACAKCSCERFNAISFFNLDDRHCRVYECNECKNNVSVTNFKSDGEMEYYNN